MKITFIIHSLNSMGGAEKILTRLANQLANESYNVSILTLSNKESIFDLDKRIQLIKMEKEEKTTFIPKKLKSIVSQVKYINKTTKNLNSDILISFITPMNIISTISSKFTHIPIIISEHNSYDKILPSNTNKIDNIFWKLMRRITYPLANHLVILTQEDKPKYHYVPNLSIINNPLLLTNNHHSVEREKIILGVGRLEYIKGFDMLIEAFSQLNLPDWKLLIAGEGKERKNLEYQIKKLKMTKKIELLGLVNDMEIYYKRASIYVLSSRSEGFPGGLCEAMGYECPSIAFDCPTGPKEIINDGVDGILVEANNVNKLSDELNNLIQDKQHREKLSRASKEIMNKLNIHTISQEWESIFKKIINKNQNKSDLK